MAIIRQAANDRDPIVRTNAVAGIYRATNDLSEVIVHWMLLADLDDWEGKKSDVDAKNIASTGAELAAIGNAMMLRETGLKSPELMCSELVKLLQSNSLVIRRRTVQTFRGMAIDSAESKLVLEQENVPDLLTALLEDPDVKLQAWAALALKEFNLEDPNAK